MAKQKTVTLLDPVPFAGRNIDSLTLREPTARDYGLYGEPAVHTRSADGSWIIVDNTEAVMGYVRACLPELERGVIDHIGLADTLRLKDAVLGFFADARAAGATTAPGSSSGNSDGSTDEGSASSA